MTAREQATLINDAILHSFRQAFPEIDGERLALAARAAANNAAMTLSTDEDE